jgi:hypothetical protein
LKPTKSFDTKSFVHKKFSGQQRAIFFRDNRRQREQGQRHEKSGQAANRAAIFC